MVSGSGLPLIITIPDMFPNLNQGMKITLLLQVGLVPMHIYHIISANLILPGFERCEAYRYD
jgi:hypothetical protein